MPYCENCGSQINPGAKFCGNCGAAVNKQPSNFQSQPETQQHYTPPPAEASVAQAPPQMQPPASAAEASSEPVFGAIIFKKPKSLGRWDTYTGVVTSQRLIFAQMTSEMLKVAVQQSRDQAKAEGKGFFRPMGGPT